MSILRLVTQILPNSYDHAPTPPLVQGTAIFNESSSNWTEVKAETTVFKCQDGIVDWHPEGLTELRKSRLRLSASEQPPPPLVRVRPVSGGVLLSVPLRIPRSDLPRNTVPGPRFLCGVCGKGYKTKKPFETHCREHERSSHPQPSSKSQPVSFQCELCAQSFRSAALYSAHCQKHQNQPEEQTSNLLENLK